MSRNPITVVANSTSSSAQKISVALCTHNGALYIAAQLQSILAQSRPPDELVICDDASTDNTVAIAISTVTTAGLPELSFIVHRHAVALGVTANFESAVRATSGDLIVLCDQDDMWHPDRLSHVVDAFARRPELKLIFSDATLVDAEGCSLGRSLFDVLQISATALRSLHRGDSLSLFIRRNLATGATIMFRRRLLEIALPFPADWVHDEWLATVAAVMGSIDAIEEKLIDYRQHTSNQIGVIYPTLRRKIERTLEPRGARNAKLARQFSQLAARFTTTQTEASPEMLSLLRAKADFESGREAIPRTRRARLIPILKINGKGRYQRFASQGRLDMVRDLLQPH